LEKKKKKKNIIKGLRWSRVIDRCKLFQRECIGSNVNTHSAWLLLIGNFEATSLFPSQFIHQE
jgi:hypothetical protein